jgi:maltose-binding protein MalE
MGIQADQPQDSWVLTKELKIFEAQNPGVTVDVTVEPDMGKVPETFKAAALAGNGPDIVNIFTGLYVTQLKDILYPLDGKVPQADLDNLMGWDTVREGFTSTGTTYAYPWGGTDAVVLGYSKKLVKAAGLDFEANPPRTAADLDAALAKIKATGVIPWAADEGTGTPILYYFVSYWWPARPPGRASASAPP